MKTIEKDREETYNINKSRKAHSQKNDNEPKKHFNRKERRKRAKKSRLKKIIIFLVSLLIIGICTFLFLLYGPIENFRVWLITNAMTSMNHQYLATWFYSDETINEILNRNKVLETDEVTDPELISDNKNVDYANEYERAVLEKDPNNDDYKIIKISGKTYSGYLAVVYDASKLQTITTKKLNKSGQYLVQMAKDNNAVIAINGGGFSDENHNSSGGSPLGITFSQGNVITSEYYDGPGGLIGFNNENVLVLGKMTIAKAKELGVRDAVTCGPFLIVNGKASQVLGNGGWGNAPRSAIGQRQDGIVLLLALDGRRVGMQGADMDDLIDIMENYGAINAANLDGGTSTAMVVEEKLINDPIDSTGAHKTRPIPTGFGLIKK